MEAIYFGNAHWRGNTGAGETGPWAGADLEQGMYVEKKRGRRRRKRGEEACALCVLCVLCTVYCGACGGGYCVRCTACGVLCTVYCVLCTVYCVRWWIRCVWLTRPTTHHGIARSFFLSVFLSFFLSFFLRYYGGGEQTKVNNNSQPLTHEFVSLVLKGREDGFTIKGGDATSGTQATM